MYIYAYQSLSSVVKTQSVALEVYLSIMYASREATFALVQYCAFKKRVVWFAGSRVWCRTSGLPDTMNYL